MLSCGFTHFSSVGAKLTLPDATPTVFGTVTEATFSKIARKHTRVNHKYDIFPHETSIIVRYVSGFGFSYLLLPRQNGHLRRVPPVVLFHKNNLIAVFEFVTVALVPAARGHVRIVRYCADKTVVADTVEILKA